MATIRETDRKLAGYLEKNYERDVAAAYVKAFMEKLKAAAAAQAEHRQAVQRMAAASPIIFDPQPQLIAALTKKL